MYLRVAETISQRSSAERLKVGAVIVKNNNIRSIGYNGTVSGACNVCEKDGKTHSEVFHAEENAILSLAKHNGGAEESTIYITHAPCMNCSRMIVQSGIKRVVFRNIYRDTAGIEFLRKLEIPVEQIGQTDDTKNFL